MPTAFNPDSGSDPDSGANPDPDGGRRVGPVPARTAVLVAGAAVLMVEVLAARLVAPYVGLTLESYTAAIGVALLGIALGARTGGIAADRYGAVPVVAGGLIVGGALVWLVRPLVLLLGPSFPPGALSTVILVALSTLPAVTVLSMVPPAAVKHVLADLRQSGRVVGELSALGTLGALAGTFLTGYVLVAMLPHAGALAAAGGACLLLGLVAGPAALALRSRAGGSGRPAAGSAVPLIAALVGLTGLAGTALAAVESPCDVETAYYCASVVADPARPSGRVLRLDNLRHSYVDLDDPAHLEFAYIRRFAAVVQARFPAGRPLQAVHLGGGGFTMPRWLAATRPGTSSTVLELDRGVVELGRQRLGVSEIDRLRVITGDARISLAALPDDSADLVIGDAFGSLSVPWHLATRELLADVDRVLRPGGVYLLNVIDNGPKRFLAAEAATVAAVLADPMLLAAPEQLPAAGGGNFILVGVPSDGARPSSDQAAGDDAAGEAAAAAGEAADSAAEPADSAAEPLAAEAVAEQLAALGEPARVLAGAQFQQVVGGAPVLRDDYAPVDQLLTPYRSY